MPGREGVIKTYKLVIQGKLPNLNDYIKTERGNRYAAANLKRITQDTIGWAIRSQLKTLKIKKKVFMDYLWIEQNKCRDKDNIA